MATRKNARKQAAAADAPAEAVVPQSTAASREMDKLEENKPVFRVDLGQALPTPPLRTATDNEGKRSK
jgi:hypothetical protein